MLFLFTKVQLSNENTNDNATNYHLLTSTIHLGN